VRAAWLRRREFDKAPPIRMARPARVGTGIEFLVLTLAGGANDDTTCGRGLPCASGCSPRARHGFENGNARLL